MSRTTKRSEAVSLSQMASGGPRSLGPSDSSDSGSDTVGQEESIDPDANVPVDVATRPDSRRPGHSIESPTEETDTDAAGTGERRSAGNDAGGREASDITPDRIEGLAGEVVDEDAGEAVRDRTSTSDDTSDDT